MVGTRGVSEISSVRRCNTGTVRSQAFTWAAPPTRCLFYGPVHALCVAFLHLSRRADKLMALSASPGMLKRGGVSQGALGTTQEGRWRADPQAHSLSDSLSESSLCHYAQAKTMTGVDITGSAGQYTTLQAYHFACVLGVREECRGSAAARPDGEWLGAACSLPSPQVWEGPQTLGEFLNARRSLSSPS